MSPFSSTEIIKTPNNEENRGIPIFDVKQCQSTFHFQIRTPRSAIPFSRVIEWQIPVPITPSWLPSNTSWLLNCVICCTVPFKIHAMYPWSVPITVMLNSSCKIYSLFRRTKSYFTTRYSTTSITAESLPQQKKCSKLQRWLTFTLLFFECPRVTTRRLAREDWSCQEEKSRELPSQEPFWKTRLFLCMMKPLHL